MQQNHQYQIGVLQGTQQIAQKEAVANYSDPSVRDPAIERIKASVSDFGSMNGWSPEKTQAATQDALSKAHGDIVLSALGDNNFTFADQYLNQHAKEMDPSDAYRYRSAVDNEKKKILSYQVASDVTNNIFSRSTGSPSQNAFDASQDTHAAAFQTAIQTESNGQHFDKSGNPLTSPKGAVGIAQLMPNTAKEIAQQIGLKWDPDLFNAKQTGDPQKDQVAIAYNQKLGQAYFDKQLQAFGGDVQKAWAAYNAGPGAVSNAVKSKGDNWMSVMPVETQDYVKKNLAIFQSGKPSKSLVLPTVSDVINGVQNDPRMAGQPPDVIDAATSRALSEYHRVTASWDTAQNAYNQLSQFLQSGRQPSPEYVGAAVAATRGTPFEAYTIEAAKRGPDIFAKLPLAVQSQQIEAQTGAMNIGGSNPALEAELKRRQSIYDQASEDVKKDALTAAASRGVIQSVQPLDLTNLTSLPSALSARMPNVLTVQQWTGKPVSPFTAQEADQLSKQLNALPADQKAGMLKILSTTVPPQQFMAFSQQIKDKDNNLAVAAMLTGRSSVAGWNVGEMYLKGKEAISQGLVKIDPKDETGIQAQIYKSLSGVYATPAETNFAVDVSTALYAKLRADGRPDSISTLTAAVNLATGGLIDHNGKSIVKPYGWSDDKFNNWIGSANPQTLGRNDFLVNGHKTAANDLARLLPSAKLRPAGGSGRYYIEAGADVVRTVNGMPYILRMQ
jgi:hypothetical protein